MRTLPRSFYNRPTCTVAKQLLKKILCRRIKKKILRAHITEVEAYIGPQDKASHASRGKTKRNAPMFGKPGYAYIYRIYGMYWCLNVVTEREGYPAAVLIRAVELLHHNKIKTREQKNKKKTCSCACMFSCFHETNGPGKLCRALTITGVLNGTDITKKRDLWIEDAPRIPRSRIRATPRIGVDYAGAWKNKKLRFCITK